MSELSRKTQGGLVGATTGFLIGGVSSFIHSGGRVTKQTAPAAFFMAVVLGVGAAFRTQ